jgi:hypothetical protein
MSILICRKIYELLKKSLIDKQIERYAYSIIQLTDEGTELIFGRQIISWEDID